MMGNKRIVGTSLTLNPDFDLMKAAGIQWLRIGFEYPFEDEIGGALSGQFIENLRQAKEIRALGFKLMGITPLSGIMGFDPQKGNEGSWMPGIPSWAGSYDEDDFYEAYEEGCAEMARQTTGIVDLWQVSNEMDIPEFRGPMAPEQAVRFLLAGGNGIRKGNPDVMCGINPSGINTTIGMWLFEQLYSPEGHPFGYAGIDGYFGSWIPGGPQDWILWIDEIFRVTAKPVLINEWGYSSMGGLPKATTEKIQPGVNTVCHILAWHYAWKEGHTEKEQGEYLGTALRIFGTYPNVLGSFLYSWRDDAACWHCGQAGCPAECGWGIIRADGVPKSSYYDFQDAVAKHYGTGN
jgi:hypothetical protein